MKSADSKTVTICIVMRNERGNVLRCLESLFCRDDIREISYELLVIDNASQDNSPQLVKNWIESHPEVDGELVELTQNHMGRARDLAIKRSRAKYVAFIDADCEAPNGWIERGMESLKNNQTKNESVVAVGSGNAPPRDRHWFYQSLRIMFRSFLGTLGSIQATNLQTEGEVDHLSTCNVIYDREAVLKVGGFSHQLGRVCEDLELSYRLIKAGHKLMYVPGLEVTHHYPPSPMAWSKKMIKYGQGQIYLSESFPSHLLGPKILPLGFAFFWIVLFVASFFTSGRVLVQVFAGYLFALFLVSMGTSLLNPELAKTKKDLWLAPLGAVFAFLVTHLSYAAGEASGVVECFFKGRSYKPRYSLDQQTDRSKG